MKGIFKPISKITASLMVVLFGFNSICLPLSYAQVPFLPQAGTMVSMTDKYSPVVIKGMHLYPDNPFKFDFIVDTGDTHLSQDELKDESQKLITYFLASLTTPEKEMWVNLSPFEKDRIIPKTFGQTEMGKQLLAQDYLLKQIMATALYPEQQLGREFWQKVYSQARSKFGTTDVPVNTFNKVWILPDRAVVYENSQDNSVFVVESTLKVMLEQDYLAMKKNIHVPQSAVSAMGSQVIRDIVIPALEKEVNEGRNFAPLRQVYQSLILASWYKKNLRDNVIAQAYVDRNKIKGVDVADKNITQEIYKQYLRAYRRGVYNYIKEEVDPDTQSIIPRKYFSGGETFERLGNDLAMTTDPNKGKEILTDYENLPSSYQRVQASFGASMPISMTPAAIEGGIGQEQEPASPVVPGSLEAQMATALESSLLAQPTEPEASNPSIPALTPPPVIEVLPVISSPAEVQYQVPPEATSVVNDLLTDIPTPPTPAIEAIDENSPEIVPVKTAVPIIRSLASLRNSVVKIEANYARLSQALAAARKTNDVIRVRDLQANEGVLLNAWVSSVEKYEARVGEEGYKAMEKSLNEIAPVITNEIFGDLTKPEVVNEVQGEVQALALRAGMPPGILPVIKQQLSPSNIRPVITREVVEAAILAAENNTPPTLSRLRTTIKRIAILSLLGAIGSVALASDTFKPGAVISPNAPSATSSSGISNWSTVQNQLAHVGPNGGYTPEVPQILKAYVDETGKILPAFSAVRATSDLNLPQLSYLERDKIFSILKNYAKTQGSNIQPPATQAPPLKIAERVLPAENPGSPAIVNNAPAPLHDISRTHIPVQSAVQPGATVQGSTASGTATPASAAGLYPVIAGQGILNAIQAAGFTATQGLGWINHYQVVIVPQKGTPYTYINHRTILQPSDHFKIVPQSTGRVSQAIFHAVGNPWHHPASHIVVHYSSHRTAKLTALMPSSGHWIHQSTGRGGISAVWMPDRAMAANLANKGGIDLAQVNVNSFGGGVKTAFSDPEQLRMLLNADGLVPVIYKIEPITIPMMNTLLGFNANGAVHA